MEPTNRCLSVLSNDNDDYSWLAHGVGSSWHKRVLVGAAKWGCLPTELAAWSQCERQKMNSSELTASHLSNQSASNDWFICATMRKLTRRVGERHLALASSQNSATSISNSEKQQQSHSSQRLATKGLSDSFTQGKYLCCCCYSCWSGSHHRLQYSDLIFIMLT